MSVYRGKFVFLTNGRGCMVPGRAKGRNISDILRHFVLVHKFQLTSNMLMRVSSSIHLVFARV